MLPWSIQPGRCFDSGRKTNTVKAYIYSIFILVWFVSIRLHSFIFSPLFFFFFFFQRYRQTGEVPSTPQDVEEFSADMIKAPCDQPSSCLPAWCKVQTHTFFGGCTHTQKRPWLGGPQQKNLYCQQFVYVVCSGSFVTNYFLIVFRLLKAVCSSFWGLRGGGGGWVEHGCMWRARIQNSRKIDLVLDCKIPPPPTPHHFCAFHTSTSCCVKGSWVSPFVRFEKLSGPDLGPHMHPLGGKWPSCCLVGLCITQHDFAFFSFL